MTKFQDTCWKCETTSTYDKEEDVREYEETEEKRNWVKEEIITTHEKKAFWTVKRHKHKRYYQDVIIKNTRLELTCKVCGAKRILTKERVVDEVKREYTKETKCEYYDLKPCYAPCMNHYFGRYEEGDKL